MIVSKYTIIAFFNFKLFFVLLGLLKIFWMRLNTCFVSRYNYTNSQRVCFFCRFIFTTSRKYVANKLVLIVTQKPINTLLIFSKLVWSNLWIAKLSSRYFLKVYYFLSPMCLKCINQLDRKPNEIFNHEIKCLKFRMNVNCMNIITTLINIIIKVWL